MTMYVKSDVKIESPYKFNSNFIINKCSLFVVIKIKVSTKTNIRVSTKVKLPSMNHGI